MENIIEKIDAELPQSEAFLQETKEKWKNKTFEIAQSGSETDLALYFIDQKPRGIHKIDSGFYRWDFITHNYPYEWYGEEKVTLPAFDVKKTLWSLSIIECCRSRAAVAWVIRQLRRDWQKIKARRLFHVAKMTMEKLAAFEEFLFNGYTEEDLLDMETDGQTKVQIRSNLQGKLRAVYDILVQKELVEPGKAELFEDVINDKAKQKLLWKGTQNDLGGFLDYMYGSGDGKYRIAERGWCYMRENKIKKVTFSTLKKNTSTCDFSGFFRKIA